jgi:hypothetical protein
MRLRAAAIAGVVITSPSVARAEGAACGARSDCPTLERCMNNVCIPESKYDVVDKTENVDKKQTFGFFGVSVGGLLPVVWNSGGTGAQLALRLGAVVDGVYQFQLEVAPASTFMVGVSPVTVGLADFTGSIGFLVPIRDMVSWIVRFGGGGGVVFGNNAFDTSASALGFGEFRFDVAGVAIRTSKHLLVECNAPSVRLLFPTSTGGFPFSNVGVMFVTNVTVSYVF